MTIGSYCNREVVIATRETPARELAHLMREHHVGNVIIVEHNGSYSKPVGIVTDRDLVVELLSRDVDIDACKAEDIMSYNLLTANSKDGVWETLQNMRMRGVRRVPVVADNGALAGILTVDDILELLSEEMLDIVKVVSSQSRREQQLRP